MKYFAVLFMLLAPTGLFAQSCTDWNSYDFWKTATADLVSRCLPSMDLAASPNADKYAIHYAASKADSAEIMQILIDAGADLEARDAHGATALISAAFNQNADITASLITAGANVAAENDNGATALHFAALNNGPAVLTQLMNAGADIYSTDSNGKTAFDYAKRGQTDSSLNNYLILKQAM